MNINHLNTRKIWIPNFLKHRFQMVQYSNGRFISYVLCTRPTFFSFWSPLVKTLLFWPPSMVYISVIITQIPNQHVRKQNGIHLSGIQMVGLSDIQMVFKYQTIWHPTSLQPFKYWTSSVFTSPLFSNFRDVRYCKPSTVYCLLFFRVYQDSTEIICCCFLL